MPCYTVQLMSVKIEAADRELLQNALAKLKLKYTKAKNGALTIRVDNQADGTITISGSQARLPSRLQTKLNEIKRAYSQEVIEEGASQYGWTVSEDEDEHLVLRRYSSWE